MKSVRLRYVRRIKDRYGRYRYYLRRPGTTEHIRLPDIMEDGFFQAYAKAMGKEPEVKPTYKPQTMEWLIEEWQKSGRFKALAASTKQTYSRILIRMQRQDYAAHLVADFRPVHIRRFAERESDRPTVANRLINMFRMLFEYAVENGWAETNPAINLKSYKEANIGFTAWTEDQIAQFEARWTVGSLPRRAFALLLYTGQRRSDVVRMGPRDLSGDMLHVRQQKTKKELFIPLHEELKKELALAPEGPAFLLTPKGVPYTPNGFYMRFKGWRQEAGLPDGLSPHGLRKAAARRLAEAGCTTHQIAAITGHSSLDEVELYTRSVDQERLAREALRRMQKVKQFEKE